MEGKIQLDVARGDRRLEIVIGDDSDNHIWVGHCPADLVSLLSGSHISKIAGLSFRLAMGGPGIDFEEEFQFTWDQWGCMKFVDPIFEVTGR